MFNFSFGNIDEQMEIYASVFVIDVDGQVQKKNMQAPRLMIEQEFISLVQQATQIDTPVKITMVVSVSIFNQFDNKWVEREHSVMFKNNPYLSKNEQ